MNIYHEYSEIPYHRKEISFEVDRFRVVGDLLLPLGERQHPLITFVWGSGEGGRHLVGKPSKLITTFIEAGYAVFIEDKPGSGVSSGEFSKDHLLNERAKILAEEVEVLRNQREINQKQVGVYGGSQAGYVMAMAAEKEANYNFMVAVSCPAMDSVEQSAYLVRQQLLCEGYSQDVAEKAERYYVQRDRAQDYDTYYGAAKYLNDNPVIREDLSWGGIVTEEQFEPRGEDWDEFYNPLGYIEKLTIPVLAIFGEKDTQVDPAQGSEAYQTALENNGNQFFQVVTLPKTDHNMRVTTTGCLKEQMESYQREGGAEYNAEFLKTLKNWLVKLQRKMENP